MKTRFAIRLGGLFALCVQLLLVQGFTTTAQSQAREEVESVRATARSTVESWGKTHDCAFPIAGAQAVADKMTTLAPAVSARRVKYDLSDQRKDEVVVALTTAYLDALSKPEPKPDSKPPLVFRCSVSLESIQSAAVPAIFNDPDSGFLLIDGSQDKADIYIDGRKKGQIQQTFILSTGKHIWRTMKCEEPIQISPNELKKVFCSKQ